MLRFHDAGFGAKVNQVFFFFSLHDFETLITSNHSEDYRHLKLFRTRKEDCYQKIQSTVCQSKRDKPCNQGGIMRVSLLILKQPGLFTDEVFFCVCFFFFFFLDFYPDCLTTCGYKMTWCQRYQTPFAETDILMPLNTLNYNNDWQSALISWLFLIFQESNTLKHSQRWNGGERSSAGMGRDFLFLFRFLSRLFDNMWL